MGYTHYWYRPLEIPLATMKAIIDDLKKLVPVLAEKGVPLAGGLGEGEPEFSTKRIWFNGVEKCGHERFDLCIAWPTDNAGGVGTQSAHAVSGEWFAGAKIRTRVCGGDCSHETFSLPRVLTKRDYPHDERPDLYFTCCKTAFKPYDLAVTAALIVAKRHLGNDIIVSSDGEDQHWFDAQMLCETVLGYGLAYNLEVLGAAAQVQP